jgi:integrase
MARRQGTIRKLANGRYMARWFVGRIDGRREYGAKVFATRKEAADHLAEKLHELAKGMYVKPAKETLGAFLDRWEGDVATRASAKTVAVYKGLLAKHVRPVLGAVELQRVDTRGVQELVNGLRTRKRPLSAKTIRETFGALRRALAKAVAWGLIARNPTDHVERPRGSAREKRPLSADEVKRFRAAARGSHFELVWDVLIASGMRPGEALGLRWADVDLETGEVRVRQAVTEDAEGAPLVAAPKTEKSRRTLPLPDSIMAGLRRHRAEQAKRAMRKGPAYDRDAALVFATWDGSPVCHRNLRRAYLRVCERAGIEGARGPYDLRHTAATLLIEAGVPIKAVSERLGHANASITLNVYVHSTPAQQERAVAVLGALVE